MDSSAPTSYATGKARGARGEAQTSLLSKYRPTEKETMCHAHQTRGSGACEPTRVHSAARGWDRHNSQRMRRQTHNAESPNNATAVISNATKTAHATHSAGSSVVSLAPPWATQRPSGWRKKARLAAYRDRASSQRGPLSWKSKEQPSCLVAGTAAGWARGQPRTAGCCAQGEKPDHPGAPQYGGSGVKLSRTA
jgi:hypothetical protein